MKPLDHLLIIPDGSRRHARREYLASVLRHSRAAFDAVLQPLGDAAAPVSSRILRYVESAREQEVSDGAGNQGGDCLDIGAIDIPPDLLRESYRASGKVIDSMLRWVLENRRVRILTIFGIQLGNLCRTDQEILAFLEVEAGFAEAWARDTEISSRCQFRVVGNQEALRAAREREMLTPAIDDYLAQTRSLTESGHGQDLQVNILAPYDHVWEINQAVLGGRFQPELLPIREGVDLVFRSGSLGRSLTSGALPCQTAFSVHWRTPEYFPDCGVAHLERAISETESARRRSWR